MAENALKNCTKCVFNMSEADQNMHIRQSVGSTLCGQGYGPTSIPDATSNETVEIGERKAANCPGYRLREVNETTRYVANGNMPVVFEPDPEALAQPEVPVMAKPPTCMQCRNFLPPTVSVQAGGWNTGMCSVRGIMILNSQPVTAAANCPVSHAGPRDLGSIQRMKFSPIYDVGFNIGSVDGAPNKPEEKKVIVEPTEYVSAAPLTDEDKARGIRAWREVGDPESTNTVMLPIFDINFFTPEQQAAIPRTGDDEHPEEYIDHQGLVYKCAVLWMHLKETPALWGQAGTGKTEFFRHMAWLMCVPFNRISCTASTELEDIAGKMHYDPTRGTYFEYGRIPNAWKQPGIICLDEPNVAPPDVWQFIRPLTDNSKQLVLDMNNGERVDKNESAFLGMAMNPAWDVRNVGTATIADADGSRLMHIYVQLPKPELERKIIVDRCKLDGFDIPDDMLDAVMGIAKDLRALCEDDTLPITWGIRPQIKVARALKWFSFPAAYRLATADYLEPEQQQVIMDTVKAHMTASPNKHKPLRDKSGRPVIPDTPVRPGAAPRIGMASPIMSPNNYRMTTGQTLPAGHNVIMVQQNTSGHDVYTLQGPTGQTYTYTHN